MPLLPISPPGRLLIAVLLGVSAALLAPASFADAPDDAMPDEAPAAESAAVVDSVEAERLAAGARAFLATLKPDARLQAFLDQTVKRLLAKDARARKAKTISIGLIDLQPGKAPRLAHWHGDTPVYPASVVKFVYLIAAYAWQEQGRLEIDPWLDRQLTAMIYRSSNTATQKVFRTLTGTEAGPALAADDYSLFRDRRLLVKHWLEALGVTGIHSIHPTYNGGGDLYGRDIQLLQDASVEGGISNASGNYKNRQAMTGIGTAKLLALVATDRGVEPDSAAAIRGRMQRDPRKQPYLRNRIAGGAMQTEGVVVYAKTGTWGPIYADAGIIRARSGRQLALAVFIDSTPAYRGPFIAKLARACTEALLGP